MTSSKFPRQGILAEEDVKYDILSLAEDSMSHSKSYFINELSKKYSKPTIYKYLKELVVKNKFLKTFVPKDEIDSVFQITEEGIAKLAEIRISKVVAENKELSKPEFLNISKWLANNPQTRVVGIAVRECQPDGQLDGTQVLPFVSISRLGALSVWNAQDEIRKKNQKKSEY